MGPTSVALHETVSYSLNPSDSSGIDTTSYEWDWGADGTLEGIGETFSYTPTTTGTIDLKVSVADQVGNRSSKTTQITVSGEFTYGIDYVVYDASGIDGSGLYQATQTGIAAADVETFLDATGFQLPGTTPIELNAQADSDTDGIADLDEIISNYQAMSSLEQASVNPDPSGYQPFLSTDDTQDQYTHLIRIYRE